MHRPETSEYAEFYAGYVGNVPDGDILSLLRTEHDRLIELLRGLTPEQAVHRYADGKWSVKEVVGHVIDAERMFANRAHCFARRDPARLPGFDQDVYAKNANADARSMDALVDELDAVRRSTITLFRGLDETMWSHRGIGSECEFTVRALAYIIVGHANHHRNVIESRYLSAT